LELSGNKALVTKTLLDSGGSVSVAGRRLSVGSFLDFCSLCEAVTILDSLLTIESPDALPQSPMSAALLQAGLLAEFQPTVPRSDLQRLALRLPEELSRQLLPRFWDSLGARTDMRGEAELGSAGEVLGIDYEKDLDRLLAQLDEIVRYPSLRRAGTDPAQRIMRSNGYLITAAVNGVDYFPDFDRAPFAAAVVNKMYRSLSRQLYERVADALDITGAGQTQLVGEWTLHASLPIPPIAAIVLNRSRNLMEIPGRLLEVREEFSGYRQHLRNFRAELQAADTLKERRQLQRRYLELLALASEPDHEIVSVTEVLNFAEKLVPVAAAPAVPTSYSAALITQPLEWLRRWWLRRPLAVLFRMDGKLPRLHEYADMVARLWGEPFSDDVLTQYVVHSTRINHLMASAS
jgi:hypothetical protein